MGTSIVSPKSKTLIPITTSADNDSIAASQTPSGASNLTLAGTASSFADAGVGLFVTITGDGGTNLTGVNFTITGTIALVHPSSIHGSNVNLSPKSRWLVHFGYNRCDNHPTKINYKRKDVQANRDFTPLKAL